MARTYQRQGGRGTGSPRRPSSKRPVRLPTSKKRRFPYGDLKGRILRGVGVLFLCLLVAGVGFAAGAYFGLVRSVNLLGEPQNIETHPTYMYSAPLGDNEDSRRVIGAIFQGQNRKTAEREEIPIHLLNALVAKEDERFMEHGGEHHHPAVRQERLPHARPDVAAQDQGSPHRRRDRAQKGRQG
jgi:membrane peptidoglycan carboxypeptidase